MAVIAIDAAAFEQILSDLWHCLEDSSQIAVDSDVLDHLIKDQFQDSEFNETGREFLVESYKDSLQEKAQALEESLQSVLERLRKLPQLDKTDKRHPLSVSARCLSCRAVEKPVEKPVE